MTIEKTILDFAQFGSVCELGNINVWQIVMLVNYIFFEK